MEGEKDILKEESDAEEEQNRVAEGSIRNPNQKHLKQLMKVFWIT